MPPLTPERVIALALENPINRILLERLSALTPPHAASAHTDASTPASP